MSMLAQWMTGPPDDNTFVKNLSFATFNALAAQHEGDTMPTLDEVTRSSIGAAKGESLFLRRNP